MTGHYLPAEVGAEALAGVIIAAGAQYRRVQRLRTRLADARASLEDHRDIERAKGVLMGARGCTEAEAYARMRSLAMDGNLRVVEVARRVLSTVAGVVGEAAEEGVAEAPCIAPRGGQAARHRQ